MTGTPTLGERVYRTLIRLYPASFEEDHREALVELFRYRREQARGAGLRRRLAFWPSMLADLGRTAWLEWRAPLETDGTPGHRGGRETMRGWLDDVTYAGRRLARSPGFTLTALVILVLGIGVNTTAFSFVNALLFQPPPFEDPEQVVLVLQDADGGGPNSTSYPAYLDITRFDEVFSAVSAHNTNQVFLERDGALQPLLIEYATASYLEVTGLTPTRGRWFDLSGDDPNGPPAAVLTHKMWTDRLASDPEVIGSTLRIGGRLIEVVGVGPEEFNGGVGPAPIDLWLSISAMGPTGGRVWSLTRREDHPFAVRARLAPGVTLEAASIAMNGLADQLAADFPEVNAERRIHVLPDRGGPDVQARVLPAAVLTMAVVVLVLLVGTLNLANLFLVRTTTRARELAVRLALGAGRGRVVRVVLAEALTLAALGGAGGVAMAYWFAGVAGNRQYDLGLPITPDVRLDMRVLAFAVVASVVSGIVFGLLPALRATRQQVASTLHEDGSLAIGARRRFGLTGLLVAAQVSTSLVLLATAGVFLDSLNRAQDADPGFDWEGTGFVRVSFLPLDLDRGGLTAMTEDLDERLAALPAVAELGRSALLPGRMFGTTTLLLGSATGGVDRPTEIPWNSVSVSYFETMEIPLIAGRYFDISDATGPDVAIVSETMARRFWGRTDIVGETYRSENSPDEPVEIIGVVGDVVTRSLGESARPTVYWLDSGAMSVGYFVFESDATDQAIAGARSAIAGLDGRIMVLEAAPMEHQLGATLETQRFAGTILAALGTLALVLAMLGIYGVVAFAVSRRRREVGIRIALGAKRDSVVALFVRDVAAVVLAGSLIGVALSVPVSRLVGEFFIGGASTPVATTGAAVILVVTALVATAVPAMRAARTDPTEALRQE